MSLWFVLVSTCFSFRVPRWNKWTEIKSQTLGRQIWNRWISSYRIALIGEDLHFWEGTQLIILRVLKILSDKSLHMCIPISFLQVGTHMDTPVTLSRPCCKSPPNDPLKGKVCWSLHVVGCGYRQRRTSPQTSLRLLRPMQILKRCGLHFLKDHGKKHFYIFLTSGRVAKNRHF